MGSLVVATIPAWRPVAARPAKKFLKGTRTMRILVGVLLGVGVGIAIAVGTGNVGAGIGVGAGLAVVFGGGAALASRNKTG